MTRTPPVRVKSFRHIDMVSLRGTLERCARPGDRILVATDAVFSMDGDIAPLPQMLQILRNYPGTVLVLDEAHSTGALGTNGHGICEHFSITPGDIAALGIEPVIMTTFSKFAASAGAGISTFSKPFVDLLGGCPTSLATISLPPSTTAAATEAIRQLLRHSDLVTTLHANTAYLRRSLHRHDFDLLGETHVVPIQLPPHISPKAFSRYLLEQMHIWVSPVWLVAKPRIRIVVNSLHTRAELRRLVDCLVRARSCFSARRAVQGNGSPDLTAATAPAGARVRIPRATAAGPAAGLGH